jgi:hypothetical protein
MKRLQDSLRSVLKDDPQKTHNRASKAAPSNPRGRPKEARRRTIFVPEPGYTPAA